MKKISILSTAFLFAISLSMNAQHHMKSGMNKGAQNSMMNENMMQQGNMMGTMHGNMCPWCSKGMKRNMPMQQSMMTVNMLPNSADELSLTQKQSEDLIDLQTSYKKEQIDKKAELKKSQLKLKSLINENASSEKIREQMRACSEIRIDMRLAAYNTATKMKAELTPEQKDKFEEMLSNKQAMSQHRRMMHYGMMNQ